MPVPVSVTTPRGVSNDGRTELDDDEEEDDEEDDEDDDEYCMI